jgi:spermidine/putrescine transport system ATP-binding protein
MAEALVSLRGISKSYETSVAVSQIDLDIAAGEFVVLLGPSGSGKTTVLSMIGGFTVPTTGNLFIDGIDVTDTPPARRPTATVFQDYALFPHMSVRANVGFGLAMRKVPKGERNRRADEVLRLVGLEGYGGRGIHQLSGGQRQRVALARAIAVEPKVLLLDEPLGALDLALRRQMQEELVRIQKSVGTTFVHVTHDQEEAMSIADRIVVMNKGRIEDIGPPSRIYLRPATRFAATFMGESNILAGEAVDAAAGECTWIKTAVGKLPVPGPAEAGERVNVLIRPEHIQSGRGADAGAVSLGQAVVSEAVFQGTHLRLRLNAGPNGDVPILARTEADTAVTVGDRLDLAVRSQNLVLLRA